MSPEGQFSMSPDIVPPTRRRSSFRQRAGEVRSANAPAKFVPPTRPHGTQVLASREAFIAMPRKSRAPRRLTRETLPGVSFKRSALSSNRKNEPGNRERTGNITILPSNGNRNVIPFTPGVLRLAVLAAARKESKIDWPRNWVIASNCSINYKYIRNMELPHIF